MAEATGSDADETGGTSQYQVVARRFRPQSFEELVGQEDVLHSLRAALTQGRVPHAFVFSGSRGVGKTTSARILARCLNCEQGPTPTPCGSCDSCRSILAGNNPDVIEVDAASNNGVDDVRRLRESVSFATMQSRYRVVILDEAHMMSKAAFNALLKTLEEPPPKVVFVLATTERHKLPDTIQSRCQVLSFRRVGEDDLQKRLRMIAAKEGVAVPDDVLAEIAASVRGGVRDAETALERVLPVAREQGDAFDLDAYRTLTARVSADAVLDVVASLLAGDAKAGLHFAHEMHQHGRDEREVLGELVEALRAMLLFKVDGDDSALVQRSGRERERLQQLAADADTARLDAMIGAGLLGRDRLRRLEDRGAVFELALVRMAQAAAMPSLADLLAEIRAGDGGGRLRSAAGAASQPSAAPARGAPGRAGGAPAKSVEPVRPVTPVASASDLQARVVARLADKKLLQTTIEMCRFDGPDESGKVVIVCQHERKMYRDRMRSPAVEQDVRQAVLECAGREVRVEIRVVDPPEGAVRVSGSVANAQAAPGGAAVVQAEPGERTQRVIKRFGGRVVQVNPPDRILKDEPKAPPPDVDPDDPTLAGAPPDDGPDVEPEMLDPGLPPGA